MGLSRSRASATWLADQPRAKSQSACRRSRPRGVGDRSSRCRTARSSTCPWSRRATRSIIARPRQPPVSRTAWHSDPVGVAGALVQAGLPTHRVAQRLLRAVGGARPHAGGGSPHPVPALGPERVPAGRAGPAPVQQHHRLVRQQGAGPAGQHVAQQRGRGSGAGDLPLAEETAEQHLAALQRGPAPAQRCRAAARAGAVPARAGSRAHTSSASQRRRVARVHRHRLCRSSDRSETEGWGRASGHLHRRFATPPGVTRGSTFRIGCLPRSFGIQDHPGNRLRSPEIGRLYRALAQPNPRVEPPVR